MSHNQNLKNSKFNKGKNQRSPKPKTIPPIFRKNIITTAHSSNSFQNTLNNQEPYTNQISENSRMSPYQNFHNNSANEKPNPLMENSITPKKTETSGNRPLPRSVNH